MAALAPTVFSSRPLRRSALAMSLVASGPAAHAFGFEDVAAKARQLAQAPFAPVAPTALPNELRSLSYDQYRDIRFKPERALWRSEGLPFELMFFHLGKHHSQPVQIHQVTAKGVEHIGFDQGAFDYGKNKLSPSRWGDVGFAGFRVHYPLNTPGYKDELAVFLGAS